MTDFHSKESLRRELVKAKEQIKELEKENRKLTDADSWWVHAIDEGTETISALTQELTELKEKMLRLYVRKDCVEGELGQYLGVYMLQWKPEWGRPTEMFIEYEPPDTESGKEEG